MNLQVIGKQKIGSYEFVGIEGGFGKSKKAMTVSDIAKIHKTTSSVINRNINRNKKRFKQNVDIIDLKLAVPQSHSENYGITTNQWNASNNIYILSERGYAKLLKILEDDIAWEVYDLLVDEYFNLRNRPKVIQPSLPQDYATALEQLAKQVRLNESLQIENKQLKEANVFVPVQTELLQERLYTTSDLAEELGFSSAVTLNRELHRQKIVFPLKSKGRWKLYAPYRDKDFMRGTKNDLPKWTEKGRDFIKSRFTENK